MPMSLTTHPPELLRCILAKIGPPGNLCNLAQCSRQLYLSTIPHLYHDVTIKEEIVNGQRSSQQLQKFAILLLQRPDLAKHVRAFTVNDVSYYPSEEEEDSESEEPEESVEHLSSEVIDVDQAFKTAVNVLGLSKREEDDWLRELSRTCKCHPDIILALLLPTLLKVEKVYLVMEAKFHISNLEWIIHRAACREKPFDIQPAFQALRTFFHPYQILNFRSTKFLNSLFKLSGMQKISGGFGKRGEYLGEDEGLKELKSNSLPLVHLDLIDEGLSTADLSHILRAPKALNSFWYTSDSNFAEVRLALKPQENSLEFLGFDYSEDYERFISLRDGSRPMASFVSFNTVKHFGTPSHFLEMTETGTERSRLINIFPPNL